MRAAIYCRISSDRSGAGLGVDRQETDCRELADRLGWEVAEVFTDNDISAYSGKPRPAYSAMLAAIEDGHVDAIVAWHTDRLHRRAAELEEFVAICEKHQTAVQTVRAGSVDLSTASGRMVARMLGAAAQHEVDHARERMRRAKAQAAQEGRWRGGPRPFGYEADGVTVRPEEANLLKDVAQGVVDGRSLASLARGLNEAGSTGTRGKTWTSTRLRRTLLRARNAGLVEIAGEVAGLGNWPAIIPEDLWRSMRAVLTDPSRRTTTGPERRWVGSGLYRCGVCGGPLRVSRGNGQMTYRCPEAHVSRSQEALDAYVLGVIRQRLEQPDVCDLIRSDEMGKDSDTHDELAVLRNRLAAFEADYADGVISGRQLKEATVRVQAGIDELEQRLAARAARDAVSAVTSAASPAAAFEKAPLDVQRAVLDALVTVTLNPGRKGRPAGWRPGEPYTDLESVKVLWRMPE